MKVKFNTISEKSIAELREKASKFIAYAFPIEEEREVEEIITTLWKEHIKASHICYAYRLGTDGVIYRTNDDGEPSGTAGKPIYGQLLSRDVTDVLLCVVRYFGGTKLGASGLISAYKEAASLCLVHSTIVTKSLQQKFKLKTSYEHMGNVLNHIKSLNLSILDKVFLDDVEVEFIIPLEEVGMIIRKLKAALLGHELDRITEDTTVDFCKFEIGEIVKV
jgi:uncharacterized YigZ family protein